jgi:hypothetical protein
MLLLAASWNTVKHVLFCQSWMSIPDASLMDNHALEASLKTASCCMQAASQGQVLGDMLKFCGTTHQQML